MISFLASLFGASPKRSPQWRSVRAAHLKEHGECAACGTKTELEVHHIEPFSVNPSRELDGSNLITLCESRGCHLRIGHAFDYRSFNPHCVEDAALQRQRILERVEA